MHFSQYKNLHRLQKKGVILSREEYIQETYQVYEIFDTIYIHNNDN